MDGWLWFGGILSTQVAAVSCYIIISLIEE